MKINYDDSTLLEIAKRFVEDAEKDAEKHPPSDLIQIVIVEPQKKPYKATIKNTLDEMQKVVGGYIENVTFGKTSSGASASIIVNEEGKLKNLPMNRIISTIDVLVGTFFITAYNMQGDNISLTDEDCEKFIKQFNYFEVYI